MPKAASAWLSDFRCCVLPRLPCCGLAQVQVQAPIPMRRQRVVPVTGGTARHDAVGRIVQKADFERMLSVSVRQRSTHFVVHHLAAAPVARPLPARLARKRAADAVVVQELSTDPAPACTQLVDELLVQGQWLGTVVPKRHAKRATTRNLVKRQIHHQFSAHSSRLPPGLWLVRLKAPFPRQQFPSARSSALALEIRTELAGLLQRTADAHGR